MIKISTIEIIALMLSLIQISVLPDTAFLIYRYFIILLLIWHYPKEVIRNKNIALCWLLYTGILCYSTWINTYSITWVISAFMLGMQYISFFCTFSSFLKRRTTRELIQIIILFLIIFLIINDVLFLLKPYNFSDSDERYWVGNKFMVSYYHCLLGCLVYTKYKESPKKYIATFVLFYAALIAAVVHCTTGIIISITAIIMVYLPKLLKKIVSLPLSFSIALIVENILIWGSTALFTHPLIIKIMTNIFHKSSSMTGRTQLYAATMGFVKKSPLWGYGHLTSIYRSMFGYGNAQNGLFHIITQAGIIGAIIYFTIVFMSMKRKSNSMNTYGLIIYMYAMLVGSAIEINLSTQFIICVALVYAINSNSIDNTKIRI